MIPKKIAMTTDALKIALERIEICDPIAFPVPLMITYLEFLNDKELWLELFAKIIEKSKEKEKMWLVE